MTLDSDSNIVHIQYFLLTWWHGYHIGLEHLFLSAYCMSLQGIRGQLDY